jgi:tetratricopeptide (TPR) repeat protein
MGKLSLKSTVFSIARVLMIFGCLPLAFAEKAPRQSSKNNNDFTQSREAFEIEKATGIYSAAGAKDKLPKNKDALTSLQLQARVYREEGLAQQRAGNLLEAKGLYLKSLQLDPFYAEAFNDLGVTYEALESPEQAEECYLKSIRIDPGYLSPYTNLASLYETRRDLKNAAYYWKKRAQLGNPDDPWTQKARRRLEDLRLVLKDKSSDPQEENILDLTKYVAIKKSIMRYDDRALARNYFDKAKLYYRQNDCVTALKFAVDAQLLDPQNKEIEEYIEKLQTRLLSK